jgi:hypothetical protein
VIAVTCPRFDQRAESGHSRGAVADQASNVGDLLKMTSTRKPARPASQEIARRRLLKAIAATGGAAAAATLPSHWKAPAMDRVMLPVHAQTTGQFAGVAGGIPGSIGDNTNRLLDLFAPQAHAINGIDGWTAFLCANPNGDGTAIEQVQVVIERRIELISSCVDRVAYGGTDIPVQAGFFDLQTTSTDCFVGVAISDRSPIPWIRDAQAIPPSSTARIRIDTIGSTIEGELTLSFPYFNTVDGGRGLLDLVVPGAVANDLESGFVRFPFQLPVASCSLPSALCSCLAVPE